MKPFSHLVEKVCWNLGISGSTRTTWETVSNRVFLFSFIPPTDANFLVGILSCIFILLCVSTSQYRDPELHLPYHYPISYHVAQTLSHFPFLTFHLPPRCHRYHIFILTTALASLTCPSPSFPSITIYYPKQPTPRPQISVQIQP